MDLTDVVPVELVMLRYPKLLQLRALADDGWVFVNRRDPDGVVLQIDGFFLWPENVTDAFSLRSETDARGLRTLDDEGGIVFEVDGTFVEVVTQLRLLPSPDDPKAPRLVKGHGHGLWTPKSSS